MDWTEVAKEFCQRSESERTKAECADRWESRKWLPDVRESTTPLASTPPREKPPEKAGRSKSTSRSPVKVNKFKAAEDTLILEFVASREAQKAAEPKATFLDWPGLSKHLSENGYVRTGKQVRDIAERFVCPSLVHTLLCPSAARGT